MITIYDKNGNARLSVPISDKCVYYKGIMEEEYVSLYFNWDEAIHLANGDYIDTEFGRFEIVELSSPMDKTAGDGGYEYEQRFNPSWWRASHHKLFYSRQAGAEASWKMTHYAYYFMDVVVDNLKRIGLGDFTYTIEASLSEMKLVSFDGVDIISGLSLIAEAFETEWWITDNVIHLGRCEYGDAVELSVGDEVTKIEREDSADTAYATRLYVFGSTRNLPQNYRRDESTDLVIEGVVERRLKLPEGIDHVDAWDNMAPEDVVEGIITTDDIYPHRIGKIATVTTKEYTDTTENEDGTTTETKWNAFRFTDVGITFSKEYIIAGEELRIIFQSGKLAGMDFAVTFNPDGVVNEQSAEAQVWEIVRNEDYGVNLPTDNFAPEIGDTYILYGYDTSFVANTLLPKAEAELLEFAKKKVAETSMEKANYNCTTNPIRCAGYCEDADGVLQYNESDVVDLDMGTAVKLIYPAYFGNTPRHGRIRSLEKHLDNRYNCTYSIGESKGYSRIGALVDNVNALTYQSQQYIHSSGSSVYLIKRQDSTTPSEHNAYSSLRARVEFMCRSVAEYVRTRWTFRKGLSVGLFKVGESGAEIDEAGDAEVGGLLVRDALEVRGGVQAQQIIATDNIVAPQLSTPNYRTGGLTGEGAGIYTDNAGLTHGEFDYIMARRGLVMSELTIEEINSVAGGIVASKAHGEVESVKVVTGADGLSRYEVTLKDTNMFQTNDLVRFARWDYTNNSYRWAWVPVRGCDTETRVINIWASDLGEGMSVPEEGDTLVLMGNTTDSSRQGFVYITDDGVQCFDGVNSPSLEGKCRGVFGNLNGITDKGKALSGYGVWTDNLYIGTGKTIVETFTDVVSQFDVVNGKLTSTQNAISNVTSDISTIEQTVDSISTRVEEVNTSLSGKIATNTTAITQNSNAITSEVTARSDGDAELASVIEQTASGISLRLSEMSLANINHAYGTDTAIVFTSDFGNKENKAKRLYDVSGIVKGDIVTISFQLRLKGIVWGDNAVISLQLSDVYGYRGFPLKITQAIIDTLTPDADGYYTLQCQATSTPITSDAQITDVGYVYMRLDYVDAEAEGGVIEVSKLKLELGDTATAWTARTGDMDEALLDTGIDISAKQIKATADNFRILNNRGAVTMEVDADGNLTSNAVLVRNTDPTTAEYTPYLTTINLATGYLNTYYPLATDNGNGNLALQIGWDESTQSVFRFYTKDGVMAWKAGSQASLIDTTQSSQMVISPVDMYLCKATTETSAATEIKVTGSLRSTRMYKKVEQSDGVTTTTYYSDVNCTQAITGYLTDAGLPTILTTDSQSNTVTYTRHLYPTTNGVMSLARLIKWTSNDLTILQ